MKFGKTIFTLTVLFSFAACKSNNAASNSPPPAVAGLTNGRTLPLISGDNVMPMTINGSTCSAGSYANKPCVSVTLCDTGTTGGASNCTTVDDILVDTGSYGLRVFKSALPGRTFTQVVSQQGGELAECAKFGDGSAEWGPVQLASLILGNEPAVQVPIHLLDAAYATVPSSCGTPDLNPADAGLNGILGVGLFAEDCGIGCTGSHISNGMYFNCASGICAGGSTHSIADQVQNPVAHLPVDNNGVLVSLPSISAAGENSVNGYLILGVGTRDNNTPAKVTIFSANPQYADFIAQFQGHSYSSFLDTGSNGLYFPQPAGLATCSPSSAWYCPPSLQTYSAVTTSDDGRTSGTVNFQVASAATLFGSSLHAFNDLGGEGGNIFDWGLPFYFGRNVYLGIDGKSSRLGSGPYWAY